ncbi:MAG: ribosome silencing factor [Clostridia bacterium]|nr:ribosome silencing factor [Clostridia bacterium]
MARLAEDHKADDLVVLDLGGLTVVADYYVIATARNPIHARAVADAVARGMDEAGRPPRHQEGYGEGRWILQDYGDVVLHLFLPDVRRAYDLERLWGDALRVELA